MPEESSGYFSGCECGSTDVLRVSFGVCRGSSGAHQEQESCRRGGAGPAEESQHLQAWEDLARRRHPLRHQRQLQRWGLVTWRGRGGEGGEEWEEEGVGRKMWGRGSKEDVRKKMWRWGCEKEDVGRIWGGGSEVEEYLRRRLWGGGGCEEEEEVRKEDMDLFQSYNYFYYYYLLLLLLLLAATTCRLTAPPSQAASEPYSGRPCGTGRDTRAWRSSRGLARRATSCSPTDPVGESCACSSGVTCVTMHRQYHVALQICTAGWMH